MKIQQYYLACLSHASYMITDDKTKTAAVVDPQRDIDQYLADAKAGGYTIKHVFLTHFHADFIAGHIELRDKAGATIHLGSRAQAEFECVHMRDGDTIEFGDVRLEIMETPGPHAGGHLDPRLRPREERRPNRWPCSPATRSSSATWAGPTCSRASASRPTNSPTCSTTASPHKLVTLPDATLVYPAHGAGSMCGKSLSKETVSTIGEQKKFNYALQPMSREDFKTIVTADQPEAPDYFVHDAMLNRKERAVTRRGDGQDAGGRCRSTRCSRCGQPGPRSLDVRDGIDFEGGHLEGALNIALNGKVRDLGRLDARRTTGRSW